MFSLITIEALFNLCVMIIKISIIQLRVDDKAFLNDLMLKSLCRKTNDDCFSSLTCLNASLMLFECM